MNLVCCYCFSERRGLYEALVECGRVFLFPTHPDPFSVIPADAKHRLDHRSTQGAPTIPVAAGVNKTTVSWKLACIASGSAL